MAIPAPTRTANGLLVVFAFVLAASGARANCNVIPGPAAAFRGALGTLNRPFTIPGDLGQQIEITLDPAQCDAGSTGFLNVGGGLAEDDYFVTILFEPPDPGAARNALVLTTAVNASDCATKAAAALWELGLGASARCQTVLPGTQEFSIPSAGKLAFRFPDTDADLLPDDDDRTYTGPTTLAVTLASDALPFGLADTRCAAAVGLVACIDELYADDGTCGDDPAHVDSTFGHFTALPPANDYRALCTTPNTECTGAASELRFTIDQAGHALVPVDWRGVLLRPDGIPVPRLLRGGTEFPAFASAPLTPIRVPGRSFLASYAPSGRRMPPIFEPLADPSSPSELVLFGSVDAPIGVMRIARRLANDAGVHQACDGGANDDLPCVEAEDCPDGTCGPTTCHEASGAPTLTPCTRDAHCPGAGQVCGPSLFDVSDRLSEAGVGPVLIPSAQYALEAQNPVPLEGLLESPSMFVFVELEAIAGDTDGSGGPEPKDLNGDGDTNDAVIVLRDRRTGTITPIGSAAGDGRAATRIYEPPFSSPAVAVEGDIAAFLESEPLENIDANGDGDVFDSILRVYRMATCGNAPCAQSLVEGDLAVDADPFVEGASIAVAAGRVYFRVSEPQNALQITTRITGEPPTNFPHNLGSYFGSLSRDGRYVNFTSDAVFPLGENEPCTDTNGRPDVYSFDRDANGDGVFDDPGGFALLSLTTYDCQGSAGPLVDDGRSSGGGATPDGRFVRISSAADLDPSFDPDNPPNDVEPNPAEINKWIAQTDAYIRDRDVSGNGIFDEWNDVATFLVGVTDAGTEGSHSSLPSAMTPDGRFVVVTGRASLVVSDGDTTEDVFVRDLVLGTTMQVGLDSNCGGIHDTLVSGGSITDDGRFLTFVTSFPAAPEDADFATDVYLVDRDLDGNGLFEECSEPGSTSTTLVSLAPPGEEQNFKDTSNPTLSADGSRIAFWSDATNLVPGDTNAASDGFVKDLRTGVTTRISVDSAGLQGDRASTHVHLHRNGRYVAFSSTATNLVSDGGNGVPNVFLHDLVTRHTMRVSKSDEAVEANDESYISGMDDRFLAFGSRATNLTGSDQNASQYDVFVRGPDTTDPGADLSGDVRIDDTVLVVLDTTGALPSPVVLGPAEDVSVAADGAAAFLRPEDAGTGFTCNGDGDFDDACVYLSTDGASALALGRTATAVAVTPELVAALVPDGMGASFVQVYDLPAGPWSASLGPPAEGVAVSGALVTFRAVGTNSLHVYDHEAGTLTDVGEPAEDFVSSDEIVAFRTREVDVGVDLNGDADTEDDVLRVWDRATQQLLETGQAVTPCRFEACRPRWPYRVSKSAVTFLTLEADQGNLDLDGNGDADGIVIQTFNARKAASAAGGGASFARAAFAPLSGGGNQVVTLAGVSAGICTTTGEACATDHECGGALRSCFLPPGGCIQDLQTPCSVSSGGCGGPDEFCVPIPNAGGAGTCHLDRKIPCSSDAVCAALPNSTNTVCEDGERDRIRLSAPLAADSNADGALLLPSLETREGTCSSDEECEPDEFCAATLRCQPDRPTLVTAGSPDTDRDGVDDGNDNCVHRPNPEQSDLDGDGVGDVCDLETCGDGLQTYAEECDGGNAVAGDGCDAECRLEGGALPACQNGLDDDGDGRVDLADAGCTSVSDASERDAGRRCDDGVDNDGDGGVDYSALPDAPGDPGCASELAAVEDPQCQNGLDDDDAPGIDFDGGASLGLTGPPDPQCAGKPWKRETPSACGLGPEMPVLLALVSLVRRRTARNVRWRA